MMLLFEKGSGERLRRLSSAGSSRRRSRGKRMNRRHKGGTEEGLRDPEALAPPVVQQTAQPTVLNVLPHVLSPRQHQAAPGAQDCCCIAFW
jgi:hypothetical protein